MKIVLRKKFLIFVLWLCCCGFSGDALTQIKSAILQKDYEKSLKLAGELITSDPQSPQIPEVYYYEGLSRLHLGSYLAARTSFYKVVELSTSQKLKDKAYLNIIDTHSLEKEYAEAFNVAQKLLRVSPKSDYLSSVYLRMARSSLRQAHWLDAKKYLNKIVQEFPDSMEYYLANQLLEEKQYFAVQVGSFQTHELAQKLVNELKEKGQYAYIVETKDKNAKRLFRVRVGQFARLNEAQHLKDQLSTLGYSTHIYP